MTSRIIVAVRVAATPERAFDVFTRDIGRWWRPTPVFQFAAKKGGAISLEPHLDGRLIETADDGTTFEIGRVVDWRPGAGLAFTWRQASFSAEQSTTVMVRFDAIGPETRVTVEHQGWDSVPLAHVARHAFPNRIFLERHGQWWQALLESMKRRVEHDR